MKEENPRGFDGEIFDMYGQLRDRIEGVIAWPMYKKVEPIRDYFCETAIAIFDELQKVNFHKIRELRRVIDDRDKTIDDLNKTIDDLNDSSDGAGS